MEITLQVSLGNMANWLNFDKKTFFLKKNLIFSCT